MMIYNDYRFNQDMLKSMIGKRFQKYKSDPFLFTNTVTGIVSLYIDDKIFILNNVQKTVDYYGETDDMAIWSINEGVESDVHSVFIETKQFETQLKEQLIQYH